MIKDSGISIHAPRAGCDITVVVFLRDGNYFNPRTPCGVRRADGWRRYVLQHFNPRTPCGVRPALKH